MYSLSPERFFLEFFLTKWHKIRGLNKNWEKKGSIFPIISVFLQKRVIPRKGKRLIRDEKPTGKNTKKTSSQV